MSVNAVNAHIRAIGHAEISLSTFKVATTIFDHDVVFLPDLLIRKFDQGYLDLEWTPDISYLTYGSNLALLCAIRDERSGGVLGFAAAHRMRGGGGLVVQALQEAAFTRKYDCTETIFHSDRGSEFNPVTVVERRVELGPIRSMGATGRVASTQVSSPSGHSSNMSNSAGTPLPP